MSKNQKYGNILIVDDDEDILVAGRLMLSRNFAQVITCRRPETIPELLKDHQFDAILLDMNFGPGESSGQQGLDWLGRILEIDPQLVVVMITAHGSVDTVVEAMKLGAMDFVSKPWQNEKVVATLTTAVALHRSRVEAENLRQANRVLVSATSAPGNNIIARSDAMNAVFDLVDRAAPTDANVLVLGENGTGKELIARELHRKSSRADSVFLSVDVGSIAESLFESEMFGHRKGAFTGATEDRPGRFQAAGGGTLFLDEVGNLPLHLQAKLLAALEQRQVTPVGSDTPELIDVRIISATNAPAARLRDESRFRPDLLFRLNTVEITLPPLRDRRDDILPIAEHYLAVYSRKYADSPKSFSAQAADAMRSYDWPGNVRALRHAVERAVILAPHDVVEPQDLQLDYAGSSRRAWRHPYRTDGAQTRRNGKKHDSGSPEQAWLQHLTCCKRAGLTRASLYRRMEKHGL